MINRNEVNVVASPARCLHFPVGCNLKSVGIKPDTLSIRSEGTGNWPMVSIEEGAEPSQAGTLWLFLNINKRWYATGAVRLRPNQTNGDKPNVDNLNVVIQDWLYDPSRWGIMSGYVPTVGESVGFMLVSGDTRSNGEQTTLNVRSNILEVQWLTGIPMKVVWDELADLIPNPPIEPEPPPPPVTEPPPIPFNMDELVNRINAHTTNEANRVANQINESRKQIFENIFKLIRG